MDPTYWHKQVLSEPLYGDLIWSRPENRATAGKLLIIGGNSHGLTAPGIAYTAAVKAGVGSARVLLPDAIRKAIGNSFDEGEFVFSTPSGSFAKSAINQVLENAEWADGVLLAGDFGRNSETAILIDEILEKYEGPLTLTQDALDHFLSHPAKLLERPNTLIAASLPQLQKLAAHSNPSVLVRQAMSLHALVGILNSWSEEKNLFITTSHLKQFIAVRNGEVSTTPDGEIANWQVPLAVFAAVWWLQQPAKPFQAATTGIYDFLTPKSPVD
jgi:hypothetical protein